MTQGTRLDSPRPSQNPEFPGTGKVPGLPRALPPFQGLPPPTPATPDPGLEPTQVDFRAGQKEGQTRQLVMGHFSLDNMRQRGQNAVLGKFPAETVAMHC